MMGSKHTIHAASFKAKVALAAVKEQETVNVRVSKFAVHLTQLHQ